MGATSGGKSLKNGKNGVSTGSTKVQAFLCYATDSKANKKLTLCFAK
jgi:hypothetical protein